MKPPIGWNEFPTIFWYDYDNCIVEKIMQYDMKKPLHGWPFVWGYDSFSSTHKLRAIRNTLIKQTYIFVHVVGESCFQKKLKVGLIG